MSGTADDSEYDEALENQLKKSIESTAPEETVHVVRLKDAVWKAFDLTSTERYNEIREEQIRDDMDEIFVCKSDWCWGGRNGGWNGGWYRYSVALFEKSKDHAMEFFAKRDKWSEDQRKEMCEIPEHERYACRECRKAYGLSLVLDKAPSMLSGIGNVDENVLHGEWSYRHTGGYGGDFDPSCYIGGAFSSFHVGMNARSWDQLMSVR